MAFEKRIASENVALVDAGKGVISQIFNKLGKSEATELEVLRTAKTLGIELSNLRTCCDIGKDGLLRPRNWYD